VSRVLLDSHVLVWWLGDSRDLGPTTRTAITEAESVFISAVTPWELRIKAALGRLDLPGDLLGILAEEGFEALTISLEHGARAAALPWHHRDPFDRMLIAQAVAEDLVLVTADAQLTAYDVRLLPARD